MITEDQLEQLAIQWFQDTGWNYIHGAVIAPEGVAAEREDFRAVVLKGRLAEVRRRVAMPGQPEVGNTVGGFRAARARACCSWQVVARGVVEDRDMNRDIVSRFGGDSGRKWGIATEIAKGRFQRRSFPEEARATIRRNRRVQIERRPNL